MDKTEILNLPMQANDAGAETIGDYLTTLLYTVWNEAESFSGKRPFGNSGWEYDLYTCLLKNGIIEGSLDEDGDVEEYDSGAIKKADRIISKVIADLC